MYDVVYLGSGHSCWHGAVTLAAMGKKVAIVDGDLPGGTCTNYGCDAKIILDGPFEFVEGLERYQDVCVDGNGSIDWRRFMAYKNQVLAPFPQLLPAMFQNVGIAFVPEFGKLEDAHTVVASDQVLETEYVVIGTGQRDAVLDIPGKEHVRNSREFLSIEASRRGIVVDDHLRTSVPTIYASGDVIDKTIPRLTPTAEFESNYIAAQILGDPAPISYPVVPNLVFTLPRIAQVGVSLDEAKVDPATYRVVELPYGPQNEWVNNRELDAEMAFVMDGEGHLAGAAIYGSEAGAWLDFLTLVINQKMTAADLRSMIFAFPTQTYMLASTLATLLVPATA